MSTTLTNEQILEAIGSKTVLELADLVEAIKTKFNVTVVAAAAPGAAGARSRTHRRVPSSGFPPASAGARLRRCPSSTSPRSSVTTSTSPSSTTRSTTGSTRSDRAR